MFALQTLTLNYSKHLDHRSGVAVMLDRHTRVSVGHGNRFNAAG